MARNDDPRWRNPDPEEPPERQIEERNFTGDDEGQAIATLRDLERAFNSRRLRGR